MAAPQRDSGRPASGLSFKRVDTVMLLRAAVAAPSVHNIQPWLFAVRSDRIDLYLDPDRALPVADPVGRERAISCGAALEGLCLGMAHLGYQPQVRVLPDPSDASRLATVRRGAARPASAEERQRYGALHRRSMYRRRFATRTVPSDLVAELEEAGRGHGGWVREVRPGSPERELVADLATQAISTFLDDPDYRAELALWTYRGRREGIPPAVMGENRYPVNGLSWALVNHPAVDDHAFGHDRMLILGTICDTVVDWLSAGRALHAVLLQATLHGLVASMFTQILEVPRCRADLTDGLDLPGHPQAVLRVGYPASGVERTGRRSLHDVLLDRSG
ncbi:MAG: nitroreductase [Streptosporangiales bacterium]|nr:nitroreductase [Streptosporangiales bacterium]